MNKNYTETEQKAFDAGYNKRRRQENSWESDKTKEALEKQFKELTRDNGMYEKGFQDGYIEGEKKHSKRNKKNLKFGGILNV